MQKNGQYGLPELPQYVVSGGPSSHPHMFKLSHEVSALSSSSAHAHPHARTSHPQHHHQHQQQAPQLHQQQSHLHHSQHPQGHTQSQQPPPSYHQQQLHRAQSQHSQQQQQQQQQQHAQSQHCQQQQQHPLLQAQSAAPPPQQQQQQHQYNQHPQQQPPLVPQVPLGSDSTNDPSPTTNYNKALLVVEDQSLGVLEDHDEEGERGTPGHRWPRQETLALLKIRADMDSTFRDCSLKGPLWEEVSRKLAELGYHRNAKKCKEKFENVHKYYKRTKDGKTGRQDGKNYRFYSQLEALYGNTGISNNTTSIDANTMPNGGGNGGIGTGFTSPQGDKTGFLLSRGSTGGEVRPGDGSGVAERLELDYNSDLNFSFDSSDDDCEDPTGSDIPESRKRKRKSRLRFMQFFECLLRKVLEKQEQMQQKFLEALERREHDRMMREEAWRRQEIVRMTKEHELRAQERAFAATRDAALVAFLQKVTGQTLHIPQIAVPAQPVPDIHEDHFHEKDHLFDPNSKRWPRSEVHALIKVRTGLDTQFQEPGSKCPLWEEISSRMSSLGYNRSAKRCKEKWENINKYFKKAKESDKPRPENSKTCPYFHQLEALYSKGLLGQKQLTYKVEDHSDELLEQPSESNRADDSSQAHGGDSEILAITPSGENPITRTSIGFLSTSENGSGSDLGLIKSNTTQNMFDSSTAGNLPVFSQNLGDINIGNTSSGDSKSIIPHGKEKEMQMDHVQSAHTQSLAEDYEKMEIERDDTDQETQRKHHQLEYDRTASSTFMALVDKFSSDPEYRISMPTTAE